MTDVAIASTTLRDRAAGEDLATQVQAGLKGIAPDALIVFASPSNDFEALLSALKSACNPKTMVGCSSAGEFTNKAAGTGMTTVVAMRAADMRFTATIARDLSTNREGATQTLIAGFTGLNSPEFRYRTALLLVDALAGQSEDLVDQLTLATGGMYRFFGGGAGDDANFKETRVFLGDTSHTNAAVALEILSNKPFGIGARHGWSACGNPMRVTEADKSCVMSLNVAPAVEAFEDHAQSTGQSFDTANPIPFFLHNVVGVKTAEGHKLRVPLGVGSDGGVTFANEIPAGVTASIMSTDAVDAADAARSATRDAVEQVERAGYQPKAAIFMDCVATRLRLGQDFGKELEAVGNELDAVPFAGFNSHGQIVRSEGQFSGFHNCTAVVMVIPD